MLFLRRLCLCLVLLSFWLISGATNNTKVENWEYKVVYKPKPHNHSVKKKNLRKRRRMKRQREWRRRHRNVKGLLRVFKTKQTIRKRKKKAKSRRKAFEKKKKDALKARNKKSI